MSQKPLHHYFKVQASSGRESQAACFPGDTDRFQFNGSSTQQPPSKPHRPSAAFVALKQAPLNPLPNSPYHRSARLTSLWFIYCWGESSASPGVTGLQQEQMASSRSSWMHLFTQAPARCSSALQSKQPNLLPATRAGEMSGPVESEEGWARSLHRLCLTLYWCSFPRTFDVIISTNICSFWPTLCAKPFCSKLSRVSIINTAQHWHFNFLMKQLSLNTAFAEGELGWLSFICRGRRIAVYPHTDSNILRFHFVPYRKPSSKSSKVCNNKCISCFLGSKQYCSSPSGANLIQKKYETKGIDETARPLRVHQDAGSQRAQTGNPYGMDCRSVQFSYTSMNTAVKNTKWALLNSSVSAQHSPPLG